MAEDGLKYPRRKTRTVGGTTYSLTPPDNMVSGRMKRVKRTKTSIEKLMGDALRSVGVRFRKPKDIYGSPDFAIKKYKIAIFCDGDFWHGYNFDPSKIRNNSDFWAAKIKRNIERDQQVNFILESQGWKVFRFWEHDIRHNALGCAQAVHTYIEGLKNHGH